MNAPDRSLLPLVVDLDGTLTPTDTLFEAAVRSVRRAPAGVLRWPLWLAAGRAAFKARMVEGSDWRGQHIPLREEFVAYLHGESARGRRLVLATAADRRIADEVARRIGLFDTVIASDGQRNLKGEAKLQAIRETVGPDFAYAGDSAADLPIWRQARAAVLVGSNQAVLARARREAAVEREFPADAAGPAVWLRAMRVHQWVKNVLIFVPLLTAFAFLDWHKVAAALLAFVAFSLTASATYIVNDLWDLDADRLHPRKRQRPLASGLLTIRGAVLLAGTLLAAGLGLAALLSPRYLAVVAVYLVATSAYSWSLKRYVLADVLGLAMLYVLRIFAGAVAIGVQASTWLMAFSLFLFFSLALVKRCSELVLLQGQGRTSASGRDYRVEDLGVLWPLGTGAALCAAVVFGLFVSSPEVRARYASPDLLWLVDVALLYWTARLWVKTSRGEMDDDPIVFAARDAGSRVVVGVMVALALAAYFVPLGMLGAVK